MPKAPKIISPRRVAVLIETSTAYGRGLLRGIHAFIREHGHWATYLREQESGDTSVLPLSKDWHGDGIIARIDNRSLARTLKVRRDIPIIDVCDSRLLPSTPCIECDDVAIAQMAADHLLERNFKHFAFCGVDNFPWAAERETVFEQYIRKAGYSCSVYLSPSAKQQFAEQEEKQLSEWIQSLPKPVGIMTCHDFRGWQILEACRRARTAVPDEVAVIGVDNDELLCDLSDPPLTSVVPDTFRIGYLAAEAMERWMAGKPMTESIQVKPSGIVTRKSTDVFAVAEPNISKAVRLIRERACKGLRVSDVLEATLISRTALDFEFKKLLGRSAHEEIQRVQFQRVVELLVETSLPLTTIAERSGFRHAEYMTYAFKHRYGVPPSEYREKHQIKRHKYS